MLIKKEELKTDNLAVRLEGITTNYRKLQDMKIRVEADLERYNQELEKISKEAEKEFQTSDTQKLTKISLEREERDKNAVDMFEKSINDAILQLQKIDSSSQGAINS